MGVNYRGPVDPIMESIAAALRRYTDAHPAAEAEVFRYSPVSVRTRIIDPDFRGKSRAERHRIIWPLLYALDEDSLAELTMVLLITPEEREASMVNRDFEGPTFAESYPDSHRRAHGSGAATP
jgi:stress-induced morphogen